MKAVSLTLALLSSLWAGSLQAQESDVQLPEYTAEQRWQRAARRVVVWQAALLELGKQSGMTPEQVGAWAGEFLAQSRIGGAEAAGFAISLHQNHMAWPGASSEVMSSSATSVQIRFNRPWEAVVGPQFIGVRPDAFLAMQRAYRMALAEWQGIDVTWDEEADSDLLTLRTEYGPIRASNDLRWAQGAFLSWVGGFELLALKMQSGKTAREVGQQDGEFYGPGWTAATPWQLYRGMTWNAMGDPNADCEVLSASPDEVRARCSIAYMEFRVGQLAGQFDITLQDLLDNWRAFAESVAEQRGLRWEEDVSDGYRMIRVTRR